MKSSIKKLLILLLLTTQSIQLNAQKEELQIAKELVDSLFFANQVEGLEISEKSIPKSLTIQDTFFITYFLDQAGELNRMLGNYDRAIEQISSCLTYKKNWEDLKDLSLSHNNLGKAYSNKGQYELAASHFLKALALMETDNNLIGQGYYLNNLGALYDLQHNYEKAISYYERSLELKKKLEDQNGIAATSTNLGISYYNLGDFKKALAYYETAVRIQRDAQNSTKLARALNNQSQVYMELNDMGSAKKSILEALSLRSEIEDAQLVTNLVNNVSRFYLESELLDSAMYYNSEALSLAKKNAAFKPLRDVYSKRAEIFKTMGKLDSAYLYLEKSRQYDDSLINEAHIYATADMEGKYNYEKNRRIIQEQELDKLKVEQELSEKNFQILVWALISAIILGIAFLFFILYRQKQKKNALLEGQNTLISQKKLALEEVNASISEELNTLQISMEEKEQLLEKVFAASKEKELPPELLSLSKREMEVLSYLALGRTDEQIAQSLFVSKSTIKTHLRRIYSKLLVSGRAEAVAIAHKHQLLNIEE